MRKLTSKQENFIKEYFKTNDYIKALNAAYPASKYWTMAAQHSYANRLLHNDIILVEIEKIKTENQKNLSKSCTLNQRKILNELIKQYQQTLESGGSERQSSIKILEILSKISKLLGNDTNININNSVNNNTMLNVCSYLDI